MSILTSEVNYAPINGMFSREDMSHARKITVCFWPGALLESAESLEFTIYSGNREQSFQVMAEAGNPEWNAISTKEPLPDDSLRLLERPGQPFNMAVEVPGSKAKTVFSIEDIAKVLWQLSDCASRLKPDP